MRPHFSALIFVLILIPQIVLAQRRNLTTYKHGDSMLANGIYKNLMKYHDEEIMFSNKSAMLMCLITVSKEGDLTDVNTLNSSDSKFSEAVIDAVLRTKNNWLKSEESYHIFIPFYIVLDLEDTGNVIMNTKDFLPEQNDSLPLPGILLKPIIIRVGPRISYLNMFYPYKIIESESAKNEKTFNDLFGFDNIITTTRG